MQIGAAMGIGFLSCLYGSERMIQSGKLYDQFLSCLYGSERKLAESLAVVAFLSCLYGSELVMRLVHHLD